MRLAFWIASKNLASKRAKAVCAVLGIAFGVAAVGAVQVIDLNTVLGVREWHRRHTGTPDLELVIKRVRDLSPEAALRSLDRDERLMSVTPLHEDHVVGTGQDEARPVAMRLVAIRPGSSTRFDAWQLVKGEDLGTGSERELLLGERAAQRLGVAIGDRVALQRPATTASGCLDGEIIKIEGKGQEAGPRVEFVVTGLVGRRYLGGRNGGQVAITSFAGGQALLGDAPYLPRFWVKLGAGVSEERVTADLEPRFDVSRPQAREVAETPEERAFRSGVRLASFLALAIGLFIIFHLLTLSVTEWVRQMGLLGALGVTRGTLGLVFFLEAVILATLGVILGIGLSILVGRGLLAWNLTTLGWGRPISGFAVPWRDLLWIGLAGFGACLAGAIYPVGRIRRVPVMRALLEGEGALADLPVGRWIAPTVVALAPLVTLSLTWFLRWVPDEVLLAAMVLASLFAVFILILWVLPGFLGRTFGLFLRPLESVFGVEPYLVRKSLVRGLRRFSGSVTALSLVAAGIVTLHAMTASMKHDAAAFAERVAPARVFLRLGGVPRDQLEWLRETPGVLGLVPTDAQIAQHFLLRGVPPGDVFKDGPLAASEAAPIRRKFAAGRGVIVSRECARLHGLKVGDRITRRTLRGKRSYEVLAVSDCYGFYPREKSFGIVSEEEMRRHFCRTNERVHQLVVVLDDPDDEERILDAAWKRLSPNDARFAGRTGKRFLLDQKSEIDNDFLLFDMILALTAILAGLGLLNSLLVSGMERTQELGLLRAVGITRWQIVRLFMAEAAMIGFAAAVLGALMGIPFSILAVQGLSDLTGTEMPFINEPVWILVAVVSLTLLSMCAAIVPALRAGRADVISAIRYE